MSYVLTIRTRDSKLPTRFSRTASIAARDEHPFSGRMSPTEFQIVFEDREVAIEAYEAAKLTRKPGDEIELMSHETIGSV